MTRRTTSNQPNADSAEATAGVGESRADDRQGSSADERSGPSAESANEPPDDEYEPL